MTIPTVASTVSSSSVQSDSPGPLFITTASPFSLIISGIILACKCFRGPLEDSRTERRMSFGSCPSRTSSVSEKASVGGNLKASKTLIHSNATSLGGKQDGIGIPRHNSDIVLNGIFRASYRPSGSAAENSVQRTPGVFAMRHCCLFIGARKLSCISLCRIRASSYRALCSVLGCGEG